MKNYGEGTIGPCPSRPSYSSENNKTERRHGASYGHKEEREKTLRRLKRRENPDEIGD